MLNIGACSLFPFVRDDLIKADIEIIKKACSKHEFSKDAIYYGDPFLAVDIDYWITARNGKGGLAAYRTAVVPIYASLPYLSKLHIKDCKDWISR